MANKSLLNSIQSPLPCSKDWHEMSGDEERVRFCQSCAKNVYNLSAMTRREARRFVALNSGQVCVRYVRLPNGKVQTADTKLYKITRRASQIAAGVFGATLTLSTLSNAQTPPTPTSGINRAVKPPNKNNSQTSQISFTVYDLTNALIAGAEVRLTNQETKEEFNTLTNNYGIADFSSIPPGNYSFTAQMQGFRQYKLDLQIKERIEPNIKIVLEVGSVGEFVIVEREIPLFFLIDRSENDKVKRLVNSGFDVNTRNKAGDTALHIAVEHNNLEIARFLLERGAKVNAKNKNEQTPLLMLEDNLEDEDQSTIEILRLLISKGANVNAQNEEKQTLLMIACFNDNLEAAKTLLEAGANPNLKDEDGETAFEKTDSDEIKQLLRRYGAKE